MTTFAGFKYPRSIYQLPSPCNLAGVKKKRELRKSFGPYYSDTPVPVTGSHPGGSFYHGSDFEPGRYTKWCDEVHPSIDHTGWFCDEYGDQTMRGVVIYLSHGRFMAGWSMGENMVACYEGYIYTDEIEAARAADRAAESAAEKEREYREEQRELEEQDEHNQGADAEEIEGY